LVEASDGFKVTVYERSAKFTEAGAGLTLNAAAQRAMTRVSPKVLQALQQVSPGAPDQRPFMRYYDGFTPLVESPLWQLPAGRLGYQGCSRSAFLDALGHGLPDGVIQFGKQLETYEDGKDGGKVTLHFTDGTVAMVDAGILLHPQEKAMRKFIVLTRAAASSNWLRWDQITYAATPARRK
jgi:salicylate hydroxylase